MKSRFSQNDLNERILLHSDVNIEVLAQTQRWGIIKFLLNIFRICRIILQWQLCLWKKGRVRI